MTDTSAKLKAHHYQTGIDFKTTPIILSLLISQLSLDKTFSVSFSNASSKLYPFKYFLVSIHQISYYQDTFSNLLFSSIVTEISYTYLISSFLLLSQIDWLHQRTNILLWYQMLNQIYCQLESNYDTKCWNKKIGMIPSNHAT